MKNRNNVGNWSVVEQNAWTFGPFGFLSKLLVDVGWLSPDMAKIFLGNVYLFITK